MTFVPYSAIWWYSYEQTSKWVQTQGFPHANILATPASGAVAAIVSCILTNPLDLAKTRIQVLGTKGTEVKVWETWKQFYKEKGIRSLGTGTLARILTNLPNSILVISVYEQIRHLSVSINQRKTIGIQQIVQKRE